MFYFVSFYQIIILSSVLQYAELKPVPCLTYSDAQSLRETCATPILKQVRLSDPFPLLSHS